MARALVTVFVAAYGSDTIIAVSFERSRHRCIPLERGSGPSGLAVSADGRRLYVHAALQHRLDTLVLRPPGDEPPAIASRAHLTVGTEALPPAAVRGRRLFVSAGNGLQSSKGRLPCASCHPEGRSDGLTWRLDLGPRQTPILAGRIAGTAPYNWIGSSPTLRDNLRQTVRRLGGRGLDERSLADLELFVTRYLRSPPRPTPAPKQLVARGETLFRSDDLGCAHCHRPDAQFTDGKRHDIASTTDEEDKRGGGRVAYDTPSLLHLHASAPYFHSGRYQTLRDLIVVGNADDRMGRTSQLSSGDVDALVAYLRTL
jgi:cytochrome c peroxidase